MPRAALILFQTLLLLGLAEGAARLAEWLHPAAEDVTFAYAPYRMLRMANAPWPLNREGFRARELESYRGSFLVEFLGGSVCLGVGANPGRIVPERLEDALQQFPVLRERLGQAPPRSTERGSVTASRRLRRVTRGNIALIGDASGSVDAITGEGLCLGFHQALALADAMERKNLALYEAAHRRLAIRPRFMADFMLTMDRWRWLRKRALPSLAARPELFEGLLAMHVGVARPGDFAVNCLSLGWSMLTTDLTR